MNNETELITPKQAAEELGISIQMVYHWVKTFKLQKHKNQNGNSRYYLIDRDQIAKASAGKLTTKYLGDTTNLITIKTAANLIGVHPSVISYYANRGYIFKHYVFGNNKHYLVDRQEILDQQVEVLRRVEAHRQWLINNPQPQGENNKFIKR